MNFQLALENLAVARAEFSLRKYLLNYMRRMSSDKHIEAEVLQAIAANITITGDVVRLVGYLNNAPYQDIESFFNVVAVEKILEFAAHVSDYSAPAANMKFVEKAAADIRLVLERT